MPLARLNMMSGGSHSKDLLAISRRQSRICKCCHQETRGGDKSWQIKVACADALAATSIQS